MIIFIAWLMDKYIDKPSIRVADWIAKRAVSIIMPKVAMRGFKIKEFFRRSVIPAASITPELPPADNQIKNFVLADPPGENRVLNHR